MWSTCCDVRLVGSVAVLLRSISYQSVRSAIRVCSAHGFSSVARRKACAWRISVRILRCFKHFLLFHNNIIKR